MLGEDDDDELGSFTLNEESDAERDLAPEAPSAPEVTNYEERFPEPEPDELASNLGDVHPETTRAFGICAVLANLAVFCVSLGIMLVYFRGMTQVGGVLVAVGLLAGIRTYQHYAEWRDGRDRRQAEMESTESEEPEESKVSDDVDESDESNPAE